MTLPVLYDLREAAQYLRVSSAVLKKAVKEERVPYVELLDGAYGFTDTQLAEIIALRERPLIRPGDPGWVDHIPTFDNNPEDD